MKKIWCVVIVLLLIFTNATIGQSVATKGEVQQTLYIHYQRSDQRYTGWNIWLWAEGKEGASIKFTGTDEFGVYAAIDISKYSDVQKFGFIIRKSIPGNDWAQKEGDNDRYISLKTTSSKNEQHAYIESGIHKVYDEVKETKEVRVHYKRKNNTYDGWNIWSWPVGSNGQSFPFLEEDEFGKVAKIPIETLGQKDEYGLIVRRNEWEDKDTPNDRFFKRIPKTIDGIQDIYLIEGDAHIYPDSTLTNTGHRLTRAVFTSFDTLEFSTDSNIGDMKVMLMSEDGKKIDVTYEKMSEISGKLKLSKAIDTLTKQYTLTLQSANEDTKISSKVRYYELFKTDAFEEKWTPKSDVFLGSLPTSKETLFSVWSPTASKMEVIVYDTAKGDKYTSYEMKRDTKGVWSYVHKASLEGKYYTYRVTNYGVTHEVTDPYAFSVTTNAKRGLIVNLHEFFKKEKLTKDTYIPLKKQVDAVVYEAHIRDLTNSKSSNVPQNLRGTYRGVTYMGSKTEQGNKTGLDHIKDLGITHIHFLPMFDYASVDETQLNKPQFNWGYDPVQYNAPEGSYSSNPEDGYVRLREMRQMIVNLHHEGIGTIMDVVYNHTAKTKDSAFEMLVPDYYYRMTETGDFSNGAGCGNETASDHKMYQKFMIDSVTLWAKEYKVDGFRFDLMGLHDIETMNVISKRIHEINPSVVLYGEGWTGGTSGLAFDQSAMKLNVSKLNGIAVFSDDFRNAVKGAEYGGVKPGFLNGASDMLSQLQFGITASTQNIKNHTAYATNANQIVTYVSAHDNYTLHDKYRITHPNATDAERRIFQKQALSLVLTSQGMPFLHSGSEMMRTKQGNENSYNASDSINNLDYNRLDSYSDVNNYVKNLIAIRKSHPMFRQESVNEIQQNITFLTSNKKENTQTLGYTLKATNDTWDAAFIGVNASDTSVTYTLPIKGCWRTFGDEKAVSSKLSNTCTAQQKVILPPHTTRMLAVDVSSEHHAIIQNILKDFYYLLKRICSQI